MITRSQVAKLTGMSVPTVIRREKAGMLSPRVVDGVHYFDEQVVRQSVTTLRHRLSVASLGATAGDVAADVFTDLDAGLHPIEIVKNRRLPPDVVKALAAEYAGFRGELVVAADDVKKLALALGEPDHVGLLAQAATEIARLRGEVQAARVSRVAVPAGAARCAHCTRTSSTVLCETCVATHRPFYAFKLQVTAPREVTADLAFHPSLRLESGSALEVVRFKSIDNSGYDGSSLESMVRAISGLRSNAPQPIGG